jgi:hypothetical protein
MPNQSSDTTDESFSISNKYFVTPRGYFFMTGECSDAPDKRLLQPDERFFRADE